MALGLLVTPALAKVGALQGPLAAPHLAASSGRGHLDLEALLAVPHPPTTGAHLRPASRPASPPARPVVRPADPVPIAAPPAVRAAQNFTAAGTPPAQPFVAGGWGCAAALAYLAGHANPSFTSYCPGFAQGRQAMTCVNVAGVCPGVREIVIAVPCPAAYENEAWNSWHMFTGPFDPFGSCPVSPYSADGPPARVATHGGGLSPLAAGMAKLGLVL
jgi:hypothetical protein